MNEYQQNERMVVLISKAFLLCLEALKNWHTKAIIILSAKAYGSIAELIAFTSRSSLAVECESHKSPKNSLGNSNRNSRMIQTKLIQNQSEAAIWVTPLINYGFRTNRNFPIPGEFVSIRAQMEEN